MATYDFDYQRAGSVDEALSLFAQSSGDGAKFLAGGHSLLPAMKLRLASPETLIDISELKDELAGIEEKDGYLYIGALTTHRQVEYSDLVKEKCPVLAQMIWQVGDPQVRNRGTIGGSLAHADPAADYPALVLALGCAVEARGPGGTRMVSADDFFTGMFETALQPGELITQVVFPTFGPGRGARYEKFANPASRYAVVGVAAMLDVDESGTCEAARIGVTGAAPKAFRATSTEEELVGTALSDEDIASAVRGMVSASDLMEDLSGSPEYRAHLCAVQAKKAIREAAKQAKQ